MMSTRDPQVNPHSPDPVPVLVPYALQNAASIASLMLTTEAVVSEIADKA